MKLEMAVQSRIPMLAGLDGYRPLAELDRPAPGWPWQSWFDQVSLECLTGGIADERGGQHWALGNPSHRSLEASD